VRSNNGLGRDGCYGAAARPESLALWGARRMPIDPYLIEVKLRRDTVPDFKRYVSGHGRSVAVRHAST